MFSRGYLWDRTPIIQGDSFNCSPLNLAMFKSLYKIPYNFYSPILLLGLGLSQIQGGTVKRITLYEKKKKN